MVAAMVVVVLGWGGGCGVQQRQQWHVLSPREDLTAESALISQLLVSPVG